MPCAAGAHNFVPIEQGGHRCLDCGASEFDPMNPNASIMVLPSGMINPCVEVVRVPAVPAPLEPDTTQPEKYTHNMLSNLMTAMDMMSALSNDRQRLEQTLVEKDRNIKALKIDQGMLQQALLDFGQHKEDCAYYEELGSGRLIDVEDSCSCGWDDLKKQMEVRARSSDE